jgi:hypothetical protein
MLNGSWQVKVNDPSQLRIYYEQGGELLEMKSNDPPQLISETPLTVSLYLEGLSESNGLHSNSLTLTYISNQGSQVYDSIPLTVLKFDMAVDGNRDRIIDFSEKADESALFWVNNDRDVAEYSSSDEQDIEDDLETGNDSLDNVIPCRRDLEDFARLQVEFGSAVLPGQLSFTVKTEGVDGQNLPMLNIFPAAGLTDDYLGLGDDPVIAVTQLSSELLAAIGEEPVSLPSDLIGPNVTSGFLYEGRINGQGRLILKANYNGMPVLQREINLSLYDVTYFYDHYIVEKSGNTDQPVNPKVNPIDVSVNASREGLYQPYTDEYVMFVHGWNMEPWTKKRWAETTFKRLWWQGYKGRVGLFDWPCRTLPSLDALVNYDHSEYLAWNSASALTNVLKKLHFDENLKIRLLAHSQGNVVAGEALRISPDYTVATYAASQAAISASFYYDKNSTTSISPALNQDSFDTPPVLDTYPGRQPVEYYFAEVSGKVETLVSYFNRKDYALVEAGTITPGWEYNNQTKPDNSLGYGYDGDSESYSQDISNGGFYQDTIMTSRRDLIFPDNDFEIFAFSAESRTKALGAVLPFGDFLEASNSLGDIASRDLEVTSNYNNRLYSHSRQFRSNIVDEQNYWQSLYRDFNLLQSR